jgi:LPLT family lysophospholipid transporter-like MFS transporter
MLIGFMGGLYIVPINTTLQALGHQSIGSGRAVALQGFSQNIAMLCAIGLYTLSTSFSLHPNHAITILGCNILLCATLAFLCLPKNLALTPTKKS